jgi:succinate dehydrogenase / fumarate reductase cytochrome b subunit
MRGVLDLYRTTIGKKAVMAVSGILLFGFVLVHMLGNLHLYQGAERMNAYGEFLRSFGEPALGRGEVLWIARIVLLVAVGLHLWSAWAVTRQIWAARPDRYRVRNTIQADYASRTMRWGGVILALFVFYHLADLTLGWTRAGFRHGEPYQNVVASFSNLWVAGLYIVANLALGLHLFHGLWSLFQSLGWNNPKFNHWRRRFATAFALIITVGNVSFPIAVLMGVVR